MTLPPSSRLPAVAQTIEWGLRPFNFLERLSARYGDLFTLRIIGDRTYVLVSDPAEVREVFAGLRQGVPIEIGNDELRPVLGDNSLLLLDGPRHQQHRRLLAPAFAGASIRAYSPLIREVTERLTNGWRAGMVIPMFAAMHEIALEIIISVVFGTDLGRRLHEFKTCITQFMRTVNGLNAYLPILQTNLGPWSPGGRILRAKTELDRLLESEIRRAKGSSKGDGIITMMVNATDDAGQPLSHQEIRDELVTLTLAGHDPTTSALAWAMYWIHSDRAIAERLRGEISQAGNGDHDDPSLPYLTAVCQETLRIYPMLPTVERRMSVPIVMKDYVIPAGVRIAPCIYLTHHHPDLYPNADLFRPERFLERRFGPHEFFPFGGGGRRCIGASFAPYQIKLVIASLLGRFTFESIESRSVRPVQRGASMCPSGQLRMRITSANPLA